MKNTTTLLKQVTTQIEHEREQATKGFTDWILQKDVNFFGRYIPAGTIFVQVNADSYHPIIGGNSCPSCAVDFYIVKKNTDYFLPNEPLSSRVTLNELNAVEV